MMRRRSAVAIVTTKRGTVFKSTDRGLDHQSVQEAMVDCNRLLVFSTKDHSMVIIRVDQIDSVAYER